MITGEGRLKLGLGINYQIHKNNLSNKNNKNKNGRNGNLYNLKRMISNKRAGNFNNLMMNTLSKNRNNMMLNYNLTQTNFNFNPNTY